MLCSLDGTMRLLDLLTGSPLMPIITLTTAAIQCAFVSICASYKEHYYYLLLLIL